MPIFTKQSVGAMVDRQKKLKQAADWASEPIGQADAVKAAKAAKPTPPTMTQDDQDMIRKGYRVVTPK